MDYEQITVEHNHGVLILNDATVYQDGSYRYIRGTCAGGGQTSRLFNAHSYRAFTIGKRMEWCIGSARIYGDAANGYKVCAVFL